MHDLSDRFLHKRIHKQTIQEISIPMMQDYHLLVSSSDEWGRTCSIRRQQQEEGQGDGDRERRASAHA